MKIASYLLGVPLFFGLVSCSSTKEEALKSDPKESSKPTVSVSQGNPLKKEKLQIVFCFGQSNMVGLADVKTAWYLTQPQYIPPKDITTMKSRFFNWNFYWSGVRYYEGPRKKEAMDLVQERRDSRALWRQRHRGVHGPWKEEWGPKPSGGRGNMYPFLDGKAEEEGIYKKIAEILDSEENEFNVNDAYEHLLTRDKLIASELEQIKQHYLKNVGPEDFDAFDAAVSKAIEEKKLILSTPKGVEFKDAAKYRSLYAELAHRHLGLPIAKNTYIKAHGHVAGPQSDTPNAGNQKNASGPLSVGYGGKVTSIGPEYGVGIALERLVDAPILLVKCSWGNTAISGAWRPASLDGIETPTEKANREAWNKNAEAIAKKEGKEFTPRPGPTPSGKEQYCWGMTLPEVKKVLADPGQYHPGYDPKVGYDIAGLVWFQGYSDLNNNAYGEILTEMIKHFRTEVNAPNMPVVCGTLGMSAYPQAAFESGPNAGMLQASLAPELKGTVDVVDTSPYFPLEFDLLKQVRDNTDKESDEYKEAMKMQTRAVSEKGFHYHGSAKFFILMGDAMGRSLANLMAGGQPLIHTDPRVQ